MTTLADLDAVFTDQVRVSRPDRHTLVELRAVGGVDAGRVWSLGMGTHTLGPAPDSAVVLRGGKGQQHGAWLTVTADGSAWLSFPGVAADVVPGQAPDGPVLRSIRPKDTDSVHSGGREFRWPEGAELAICGSVLSLVRPAAPKPPKAESDLARIEQTMLVERAVRCAEVPDPAAVAVDALGSGALLWLRKRRDEGRLWLRVGSAEGLSRAKATVSDPAAEHAAQLAGRWILPGLPCGIDLAEGGVLGVCGEPAHARALTRWLITQAAARCPAEGLQIRVLADPSAASSWDWAGRLPHLAAQRGSEAPTSYVATEPGHVGRSIAELAAEVEHRVAAAHPEILVVLDRASVLRQIEGVVSILSKGPELGIYAICVDTADEIVPECRAVVRCSADELAMTARRYAEPERGGITPDLVSPQWCERVAVAVAAHGSAG